MEESTEKQQQQIISVFDTVADGYDNHAMRFFSATADRLIDTLKLEPGQKVLDIATGTGVVATSCAQAVLPDGQVAAIDLSTSMLEKAIAKARNLGLGNIEFFNMDAANLKFENDYFNHAVCSFGLFFLSDMGQAFNGWKRVVQPGGMLMFSSFTELAFKPMVELLVNDLEASGVEFEESPLKAQQLSSVDQCMELMNSTGLQECKVEAHQLGYHLQSVDDWWSIVMYSGLRGLFNRLSDQQKPKFKSSHLETIQSLFTNDGLWLNVEVLISQGKVPMKP